jgi:hypothetical protein
MATINTRNEREFAHDLGYMKGDGPEIRLHLCNMADEIDALRRYIVQLEAGKNGHEDDCNHDPKPTGMYEPFDMACSKCGGVCGA